MTTAPVNFLIRLQRNGRTTDVFVVSSWSHLMQGFGLRSWFKVAEREEVQPDKVVWVTSVGKM